MAAVQSLEDIQSLLVRLVGREIRALQVFGINSLKSVSPMPDSLAGEVIESMNVDERLFTVITSGHRVVFDLQRTGRVVWLANAEPYATSAGSSRPTIRLILADGEGLDLTEPAKTKRITVTISNRS